MEMAWALPHGSLASSHALQQAWDIILLLRRMAAALGSGERLRKRLSQVPVSHKRKRLRMWASAIHAIIAFFLVGQLPL